MSADSGDSLRIPIEIKTEDLDEIRQLINDITKAQSDLHSLKAVPQKGRGTGDNSSRSAFTPSQDNRDDGIFNQRDSPTLPTQGRDKTSQTPYQRESEFAKLKNEVQENTAKTGALDSIRGGLGMAGQGAVNLATSGPQGFLLGGLGKLAARAFLPLAVLTSIVEITSSLIDKAFAPGGIWDRRFKRSFLIESNILTSLEEKKEIRAGRRVVRTTTINGLRGINQQSFSTLDMLKNGTAPYDLHGAAAARNII